MPIVAVRDNRNNYNPRRPVSKASPRPFSRSNLQDSVSNHRCNSNIPAFLLVDYSLKRLGFRLSSNSNSRTSFNRRISKASNNRSLPVSSLSSNSSYNLSRLASQSSSSSRMSRLRRPSLRCLSLRA